MRWFRVYDDIINDPKLLKLPDATRWHWLAVLCVASKCEGKLPPLDDLALHLRVPAAKATAILIELQKAGLIDKTETGFAPHNWDGRQYKSDVSTDRVKRFRNGKRNVSVKQDETVSETPPDTDTETDTEADNSEANASGAVAPIADPSIAEREFFARGREVLGKSAGGQLARLLSAKGRNVALARSAVETASTKDKPAEYIAGVIRAGPQSFPAKPLTKFQQDQQETKDILNDLGNFATGSSGSGNADTWLLPDDPGQRSQGLRSGHGAVVDAIPASRRIAGH